MTCSSCSQASFGSPTEVRAVVQDPVDRIEDPFPDHRGRHPRRHHRDVEQQLVDRRDLLDRAQQHRDREGEQQRDDHRHHAELQRIDQRGAERLVFEQPPVIVEADERPVPLRRMIAVEREPDRLEDRIDPDDAEQREHRPKRDQHPEQMIALDGVAEFLEARGEARCRAPPAVVGTWERISRSSCRYPSGFSRRCRARASSRAWRRPCCRPARHRGTPAWMTSPTRVVISS